MPRLVRIDELRGRYRDHALRRGVNPRDVDVLLGDILDRSLGWLFAHGEESIDPHPLDALLARRFAGEPLQYIRGRAEFFRREFRVDPRVLIPRPETELLVEALLERVPRGGRVVDVGTGSGCIAISAERERPDLRVVAVDRSPGALALARSNAIALGSQIALAGSDVLTGLAGAFDAVVSNPPYVPLGEYEHLDVEVRIHEPRMAITSGPSGMEIIERLLEEVPPRLRPGGLLLMEVGYGQEARVRDAAGARGWRVDAFLPDLAGIPRVVVLSRDGSLE